MSGPIGPGLTDLQENDLCPSYELSYEIMSTNCLYVAIELQLDWETNRSKTGALSEPSYGLNLAVLKPDLCDQQAVYTRWRAAGENDEGSASANYDISAVGGLKVTRYYRGIAVYGNVQCGLNIWIYLVW